MTTLAHIMRLRLFVKQLTRSTRAGRLLGGPVSTKHCGLTGSQAKSELDVEQFSYNDTKSRYTFSFRSIIMDLQSPKKDAAVRENPKPNNSLTCRL